MARTKTGTKTTHSFGKSKRSSRKRGRKPGNKRNPVNNDSDSDNNAQASTGPSTLAFPLGPNLHGYKGTRREKASIIQMQRVKEMTEAKNTDEDSEHGLSAPPAFTKKLTALAEVGGMHCPTEVAQLNAPEYGLIDLNCLNAMMVKAPEMCPECGGRQFVFRHIAGNDNGLAVRLYLVCGECEVVLVKGHGSQRIEGPHSAFDVNRRTVFSLRAIGCAYSEMDRFSRLMNMCSSMHHSSFTSTVKSLESDLEGLIVETLRFYSKAVKNAYKSVVVDEGERPIENQDGTTTIEVSYDGAWQKRFRGSKIGVGFIIDTLTGLAIDFEVLSNYCFGCRNAPDKDDLDDDGNSLYEQWLKSHEDICDKNFDGSPQAMEGELGLILWKRSVELHKLKYGEFLGDGDSHTYDKVVQAQVYGPDFEIKKTDCINHVAKRMGAAVREFADETPASRLPDKGRFQKDIVPKLQNYYGSAIKSNLNSVEKMHNAVWATWYHMRSTDEKPQHDLCPPGKDSWCFVQRALAQDPPATPGSHHLEHDHLPEVVADGLKPIYERLGSKSLLEKCSKGRTTNSNESIHHLLWSRCPKDKFVALTQVQLACIQTVIQFNEGAIGIARTMRDINLPLSPTAGYRMREHDATKETKSKNAMTKKSRAMRSKRKLDKGKSDAQKRKWEGTVYGYGLEGRKKKK